MAEKQIENIVNDVQEIKKMMQKQNTKKRKFYLGILGFLVFAGMASTIGIFGSGWGIGGLGFGNGTSSGDGKNTTNEPQLVPASGYSFSLKADNIQYKGRVISLDEFAKHLNAASQKKERVDITIDAISITSSFKSQIDKVLEQYNVAPSITIIRPDQE